MNYYKKDNKVYEFNDLQVKRGIGEEFTPITEAEAEELRKPTYTAEEINDIRINQIETKCNKAIEAVYPIYKQINITNLLTPYTEEDREVMKAFIDSKRAICHKAIEDGTKAEDVDYSDEP